ncbi:hypothetical protein ACZ87_01431 [Candidatus Erwinia dacicola]|uniref:Uncharacterized protein n=1 Tax=Candidatus Erwinia dacicola TaxID=252393 RepID=A0A328TS55_9GAMM|nr:hypothetical protein ACZ87_01431 [Candidatus Erwinia dacicola]
MAEYLAAPVANDWGFFVGRYLGFCAVFIPIAQGGQKRLTW